jgi:NADPH:quinone reductase-like Zn-dependent oxidoreductase
VAGLVESVGRNVTRFGPGDPVFGTCAGSVAEYACASETSLAPRPDNLTFEQAASVPVAALTALQGLRDMGRIEAGQQVLVHGAAGGIGTFAVQIARSFGADVTGVCSTRNVEMVRSIGAARVVDYTREDVTRGDARFDLILECVGNLPVQACRRILTPRGTCVLAGASGGIGSILMRSIQAFAASRSGGPRFALFVAKSGAADLGVLGELLQAGRVMPVIDRCYRMSETGEALRYLEAGHARGKVVITVEPT